MNSRLHLFPHLLWCPFHYCYEGQDPGLVVEGQAMPSGVQRSGSESPQGPIRVIVCVYIYNNNNNNNTSALLMAMVWGSERRTLHFRRFQTPRQTSSHHLLVIRQPQKHRCRTCASLFLPPRRGFFSCTWGAKKWHPALRCHVAKQIQNQADKSRPSIRPVPAPLNIEAPHLHSSEWSRRKHNEIATDYSSLQIEQGQIKET